MNEEYIRCPKCDKIGFKIELEKDLSFAAFKEGLPTGIKIQKGHCIYCNYESKPENNAYDKAIELIRIHKFEEAIVELTSIENPEFIFLYHLYLGLCWEGKNEYNKAIEHFERTLQALKDIIVDDDEDDELKQQLDLFRSEWFFLEALSYFETENYNQCLHLISLALDLFTDTKKEYFTEEIAKNQSQLFQFLIHVYRGSCLFKIKSVKDARLEYDIAIVILLENDLYKHLCNGVAFAEFCLTFWFNNKTSSPFFRSYLLNKGSDKFLERVATLFFSLAFYVLKDQQLATLEKEIARVKQLFDSEDSTLMWAGKDFFTKINFYYILKTKDIHAAICYVEENGFLEDLHISNSPFLKFSGWSFESDPDRFRKMGKYYMLAHFYNDLLESTEDIITPNHKLFRERIVSLTNELFDEPDDPLFIVRTEGENYLPLFVGKAFEDIGDYDGAITAYQKADSNAEEDIRRCKYWRDEFIKPELKSYLRELKDSTYQIQVLAYLMIFKLEKTLKNLIVEQLSQLGEDWWQTNIHQDIKNEVEKVQKKSTQAFLDYPNLSNIDCITLEQAVKIIAEPIGKKTDNWKFFKNIFKDRKHFQTLIKITCAARNDLSHGRFLTEERYKKAVQAVNDIEREINRSIKSEKSTTVYKNQKIREN